MGPEFREVDINFLICAQPLCRECANTKTTKYFSASLSCPFAAPFEMFYSFIRHNSSPFSHRLLVSPVFYCVHLVPTFLQWRFLYPDECTNTFDAHVQMPVLFLSTQARRNRHLEQSRDHVQVQKERPTQIDKYGGQNTKTNTKHMDANYLFCYVIYFEVKSVFYLEK